MIALATTCKGRAQHVEETLPRNLADNPGDCKFVVLDYNSPDHLQTYLESAHHKDIDSGRLVVYSFPEAGRFHMAHAKNMAHRCGILEGADILCNLDADNFTGPGFAAWAAKQCWPGRFLWSGIVRGKGRQYRGSCGRIAVRVGDFLKAGGYDEPRFSTWSPDDKDFNARLRMLGLEGVEIDLRHLRTKWHGDDLRFSEYPEARGQESNEELAICLKAAVVNGGKIGCGTVYRNFDFRHPIEIGPVPTRIFGIGMHKTGTTSLAAALRQLGIDAAHWWSPRWAKDIWEEMRAQGRSSTLERHNAITDLPIPLLYKQLDKAYPGSKFILTIRNEATWLRSVRDHWHPETNPFRASWDEDCFSHRIHQELYGRKTFDADVFLVRYRRHNAEVREYFRDRPDDLLTMSEHGWLALCRFLNKPIPSAPYPQLNAVKRG